MQPDIYWIHDIKPLRLALMPRPRAGDWLEDEISGWRRSGVDIVVSLLEHHEVRDLGLDDEQLLCQRAGIEFISFPIQDRGVPTSRHEAVHLVTDLAIRAKTGSGVAIHCRAGIGRSGLIAGCVLFRLGIKQPDIFPILSRARGTTIPDTTAQAEWVESCFHQSIDKWP
jgi:protein-tyrosine phosphatase